MFGMFRIVKCKNYEKNQSNTSKTKITVREFNTTLSETESEMKTLRDLNNIVNSQNLIGSQSCPAHRTCSFHSKPHNISKYMFTCYATKKSQLVKEAEIINAAFPDCN